tara:strand:- start:3901 stop:4401 length:501 start_codon:yes stop_codon:yes gene_type:complete
MSGLNMKAFIVSDNILYDVNDKHLEPGKYYFLIKNFSENRNVIGDIIDDNNKSSQYEFRFFSFMTMIIKAQSYLAKRVNQNELSLSLKLKGDHMPTFDSPRKVNKERIEKLNEFNSSFECIICLNETDNYDYNLKKLKCNHKFHKDCIDDWLSKNKNCPICRININ